MLDPHRLRMLHAVVTQGSVHRAADLLGYTPSTVSQHLATLQRETGLSLLERQGRGLVPTPAGRRLAAAAAEVLGQLADVSSLARDLREGRDGRFLFSYVASAGVAFVPPIVARLAREFPGVRLDLRLNETRSDHPLVPDLDIGVVRRPFEPPTGDGYLHRILFDDPHLAVVPEGHRWYDRADLHPADLAEEPLIDNDPNRGPCRQAVLDLFAAVDARPTFSVEAHDYTAAIEFVAAGVGVSIIPRLGIRNLPANVRALPIVAPSPVRTLVLRTRAAVADHPVVVRATGLLLDAVERHLATDGASAGAANDPGPLSPGGTTVASSEPERET